MFELQFRDRTNWLCEWSYSYNRTNDRINWSYECTKWFVPSNQLIVRMIEQIDQTFDFVSPNVKSYEQRTTVRECTFASKSDTPTILRPKIFLLSDKLEIFCTHVDFNSHATQMFILCCTCYCKYLPVPFQSRQVPWVFFDKVKSSCLKGPEHLST